MNMKNAKTMLKEIANLIGMELSEEVAVALEQMKLENGTIIEAEKFEPEYEVFIITDTDKVALPVGEYALEDGRVLVVEAEGIIKEVKEVSGEEAPAAEEAPVADTPADVQASEEVNFATIEDLNELKSMIAEIKESLNLSKQEVEAEKAEVEALKEELSSQAAAEPLKHNPEVKKKVALKETKTYRKPLTTKDRVMAILNK